MSVLTKPISINDAKTALSANTNDLGSLCSHANINKWSKYKPFRNSKLFFTQDIDGQTDRNAALKSACYGLVLHSYSSLSEMITAVEGGTYLEYLKPRGGDNSEYYRIADFLNYNASAEAPVKSVETTTSVEGAMRLPIQLGVKDDYTLKLSELNIDGESASVETLEDYYVCLCLYNSTNQYACTCYRSATTTGVFSDPTTASFIDSQATALQARFPLKPGTFNAFVFLSDTEINGWSSSVDTCVPLINAQEITIPKVTVECTMTLTEAIGSVDSGTVTLSYNLALSVGGTEKTSQDITARFTLYDGESGSSYNVNGSVSVGDNSLNVSFARMSRIYANSTLRVQLTGLNSLYPTDNYDISSSITPNPIDITFE